MVWNDVVDARVPLVRRLFRLDSDVIMEVEVVDVLRLISPPTDSVCPVI